MEETERQKGCSKVYNHKHGIFHLNITELAEHFFSRLLWQRASLNGYSAAAAQNGSVPAVLAGQPANHNSQPTLVLVNCQIALLRSLTLRCSGRSDAPLVR